MTKKIIIGLITISILLCGYSYPLSPTTEVKAEDNIDTCAKTIPVEKKPEFILLGVFRVTAYCPWYKCSEGWGKQTSTGVMAREGVTIAVDPRVIPFGVQYLEVYERV